VEILLTNGKGGLLDILYGRLDSNYLSQKQN